MSPVCLKILVWATVPMVVDSFLLPRYHADPNLSSKSMAHSSGLILFAKSDDKDLPKGMEDAFKQLDAMKSLGDDTFAVPEPKTAPDEAFTKALQEIDLKGIDVDKPSPEKEVKLYQDMASELEGKTEEDLIASMKEEIEGTKIKGTEIPKFDPTLKDKDEFMEQALSEAVAEAEKKADMKIDKSSLLDNKEIMKEIEGVFDKANEKLLQGLQEIREEQMQLAKQSAERDSKKAKELIDEEEQRLALAEANMKKMLAKVNEETRNVEEAIADLKKAQEEMGSGVEGQLSGLKSGGLVKQATLVGTVLFTFRSLAETAAVLGGDATHMLPAVIQAAIAITCLVAFLFL